MGSSLIFEDFFELDWNGNLKMVKDEGTQYRGTEIVYIRVRISNKILQID